MAELTARRDAYRATVVYRLGSAASTGVKWKRTTVPTLDSVGVIRGFAIRAGAQIEEWLVDDAGETELERCEGRWRPAVRALAAPGGVGQVPSMEESLAAFVRHVLPMERARRTRQKYATHRLTVLTWAVWKGVLGDLLPMSTDALRAFIWGALAIESTISVL
jgi:plasmid stabilization system protein ParE